MTVRECEQHGGTACQHRKPRPRRVGHVGQALTEAFEAAGKADDLKALLKDAQKAPKGRGRGRRPASVPTVITPAAAALARIAKASGVAA